MPPADLCTPRGFVGNGLRICLLALAAFATSGHCTPAQPPNWQIAGNPDLQAYFETEVEALESANDLTRFKSLDEWSAARTEYRQQLSTCSDSLHFPSELHLNRLSRDRGERRVSSGESSVSVSAWSVCHRRPVSSEERTRTFTGSAVCLWSRSVKEGRCELWKQSHLPASWSMVCPQRICVPDDRQPAAWRDRGDSPWHSSLQSLVVECTGLYSGRCRSLELHQSTRLSGNTL